MRNDKLTFLHYSTGSDKSRSARSYGRMVPLTGLTGRFGTKISVIRF